MIKKNIFLFVVFLITSSAFAQKRIYFCEGYTPTGEPIGTSNIWNIRSTGGKVYILYKNDSMNINTSAIFFFIDKREGKEYKEFFTKNLTPDKNKNWIFYDFKFTESGEYKVLFIDAAGTTLATEYVTIKFKTDDFVTETTLSSDYYTKAKVIFCESVDENGDTQTMLSTFKIPRNDGGFAHVLINHVKPLKTTELIVDIWKGDDYKKFVETKRMTVEENWEWADFQYTFTKEGKYKFVVHNKDEVYIQTGYISIAYQ